MAGGQPGPNSMQVMVKHRMNALERRREEVLSLVCNIPMIRRGVESKRVLPGFALGDYVLVARFRQPDITPKVINTGSRG